MSAAPAVKCETPEEGITLLRINRPERMNALGMDVLAALHEHLDALRLDRECRVLILTGADRAFCSGADLKEKTQAPGCADLGEAGRVYKTQEYLADMILKVHELPQPVIAVVNGPAVGGGLALALACDLRIAEESARFGAVFIKIGLSSCDLGVSYLLPRIIGPGRAMELMLTGRIFAAEEAESIGLLHRRVADGAGLNAALELGRQIRENNEYGVWMTRQGLRLNLDAPSLRHAMELENRTQALGYFTGNAKEAMEAFAEKRKPHWRRL